MSQRLSVLQRATRAHVRAAPFPHLVLKNALPDDLYAELAASFPSPERLRISCAQNNKRWNYGARQVRKNAGLPMIWRDFIAYHASQDFFDEIVELFWPHIHAFYPDRYKTLAEMKAMRAGVREIDDFAEKQILVDAMISGNTPVTEASSVRTTHVDSGDKLYSGLFYMRPEGYDAVGGDLTISRFKRGFPDRASQIALFKGPYVKDAHVEHVETVAYDKNVAVLFLNTLASLHGVTVRQPSAQSRLFVNLVGEIEQPLYVGEGKSGRARYFAGAHLTHDPGQGGWLSSIKRRFAA